MLSGTRRHFPNHCFEGANGMSTVDSMLTAEELRAMLDYDPDTGIFTWRIKRPHRCIGSVAGSLFKGYIRIKISGKGHLAHRLAWLHLYGVWPSIDIDHKNLIRSDNRRENLREATDSQNRQNTLVHADNASGFKGVTLYPYKTRPARATIMVDYKQKHIGYFKTAEDAAQAYAVAAATLHSRNPMAQPF